MRLTSKLRYGLRALMDLALHANGPPVQSHDIAMRQGIPESYLNQLLILLRRSGLVRSIRGPQGGHQLARAASAITLADVVLALDGPNDAEPTRNAESRGNDGTTDLVVRDTWEEIDTAITAALTRVTLDAMVNDRQSREAAYLFEI